MGPKRATLTTSVGQALIAFARDYHYKLRVRLQAAAILRQNKEKVA
jgi:hypothetical protein